MKTLFTALAITLSLAGSVSAEPGDRLDAARLLIFDRDWPKAVAELRRVLQDPKEPLRDEASYWLAQSLFQMGRPADALGVIDTLERDHPRSRWVLPAQSLRVEVATRTNRPDVLWRIAIAPSVMPRPARTPRTPLVAPVAPTPPSGPLLPTRRTPPAPPPPAAPPAPAPPALTVTDVRIQALGTLLRHDPERAVPVLREIVIDEVETPQARRALFVHGLSPHEDARQAVIQFAHTGPEGLRVVAVEQMGRWATVNARTVLASVYTSSTGRVKTEVLRSLAEARADRELIRIVRVEKDAGLREYAIAQLRLVDTPAARAFLRSLE